MYWTGWGVNFVPFHPEVHKILEIFREIVLSNTLLMLWVEELYRLMTYEMINRCINAL